MKNTYLLDCRQSGDSPRFILNRGFRNRRCSSLLEARQKFLINLRGAKGMIHKQLKLSSIIDRQTHQEKYVEYYHQPVVLTCSQGKPACILFANDRNFLRTSGVLKLTRQEEGYPYVQLETINSIYRFERWEE